MPKTTRVIDKRTDKDPIDPAPEPRLPEMAHVDDVLAAQEAILFATERRERIIIRVCDVNPEKRGIAQVLSRVMMGACECAQVSVKEMPCQPSPGPNGTEYYMRITLKTPDLQLRDNVVAHIMGVAKISLEMYGYRVRVGLESDVQPS